LRIDQKTPLLTAVPQLNLNLTRIESLARTVVLMDCSEMLGVQLLFLEQLTTTSVVTINVTSTAGIRKEPGFMKLI
jgi:hypothetical protein